MNEETNNLQAVIDTAMHIGDLRKTAEGGQYALVPAGAKVHEFDYERLLANPRRKRASVTVQDAASFIFYFNTFGDEHSVIFADAASQSFKGVLDYHCSGSELPARWREHTVSYATPKAQEWQTWYGMNGKQMAQVAFATFLEDNLDDIRTPAGAQLLEIARTLEAKKNVNFGSSVRLDNGQAQFTYEEEIKGSASKGTLEIPEEFKLGIPVFYGGEAYAIRCRLRWRLQDGRLTLWYNMIRPDKVLEDAFSSIYKEIAEGTKAKIVKGVA